MKVLQPFYYDDFECIGGECTNTCCAGWRINIDKKSFLKYKKISGEFGKRVAKAIKRNRKGNNGAYYGSFILDKNNKCPLLNEDKFCDLYINEGENYLCEVCKTYPRTSLVYKNILERNLSLSCPEVAKKIVFTKDKFSFDMKDEDIKKEDENITFEINANMDEKFDMLWEGRSLCIDIIQDDEIPMWKRVILIEFLEKRLQKLLDTRRFENYKEILEDFKNEVLNFKDYKDINKVNDYIKAEIILNIINQRKEGSLKICSDKLENLFEGKTSEQIQRFLEEKEHEFNEYFQDKEYIYENYIVYSIYSNYMNVMKTNDLHKEVVITIISYSMIKLLFLTKWYDEKSLSDDDIISVLLDVSRMIDHGRQIVNEIYEWLKKNGLDTPGYLATLIY